MLETLPGAPLPSPKSHVTLGTLEVSSALKVMGCPATTGGGVCGGEANCGPGKPGNLVYGTPKENAADKLRNVPLPLATRRSPSRRVADYVRALFSSRHAR